MFWPSTQPSSRNPCWKTSTKSAVLGSERERDPPDAQAAERHYRGALARAEELEMRPLLAHCHLGLGKLYWRTGQREQARDHLTAATTMYREMDMRFWLEKAEAEMRALVRGNVTDA